MSPSEFGPTPESGPDPSEDDAPSRPPAGPLEGRSALLHPAALGVWLGRSLLSLVIFVVVAGMVPLVGLAVLGVLLLSIGVRYARFRWRLEPDAVVVEEGLLVRKRRVIRRDRIQTVDLKRSVVHRALGVVEVRIEAVGAGESQAALAALEPALADRLRDALLHSRPGGTAGEGETLEEEPADEEGRPAAEREEIWAAVSPGALVVAGLTGGRVGVVAAGLGFLSQVAPDAWWTWFYEEAVGRVPDPTAAEGLRVLLLAGLLIVAAAFLLSMVATVVAHWGFTLSSAGGTLAVRRGLLTEHRDTVPLVRVQAVRVEENLVRRLLGLAAVRAVVAGRAGGGRNEAGGLLLPVGGVAEAYALAGRAVGLETEALPDLTPMPPRARRRRLVRALAASLLVGAGAALVTGTAGEGFPWALAASASLAFFVPAALLAEGAYRGLGWAQGEGHLVVREGVLNRRTTFVPLGRLQVLETRATPFQRWAGLSTLYLRIASTPFEPAPRALDLEGKHADAWREALARRV